MSTVACDLVYADLHSAPYIPVEFHSINDGPDEFTDPATVTFDWETVDGTHTTWTFGVDPEVVKDSVGHYHVYLPGNVAGRTPWEWVGTGNDVNAAASGVVCFRRGVFA